MDIVRVNKSLNEEGLRGHRKTLSRSYRRARTGVLYRSDGAKPNYCFRCDSHCILTLDVNGLPMHLCPVCDFDY